jgi:hypothetical protein
MSSETPKKPPNVIEMDRRKKTLRKEQMEGTRTISMMSTKM